MAVTYQSDVKTTLTNAKDRISGQKTSGRLERKTATYTFTGAEVSTDIIEIMDLPIGSIVVPALCRVVTSGTIATACTIDIGDATDPNRYGDDMDVAAAGSTAFDILTASSDRLIVEADTTLIATLTITGTTNAVDLFFEVFVASGGQDPS